MSLPSYTPKSKFKPKDSSFKSLLGLKFYKLILIFSGIYCAIALMFSFLYFYGFQDRIECGNNQDKSFETYLHFSFTTQATVGYGDCYPKQNARWIAALQGFVGIIVNSFATGIVLFKFLKREECHIRFPKFCCYDPKKNTFIFRFINNNADRLIQPDGKVLLARYPLEDEDPYISRRPHGIKLDEGFLFPFISSGLLFAFRTVPVSENTTKRIETLLSDNNIISAIDIRESDTLMISLVGSLESTNSLCVAFKEYNINEIKCGIFKDADDDFELLDEVIPTEESYCLECKWYNDCKLDIARNIKSNK